MKAIQIGAGDLLSLIKQLGGGQQMPQMEPVTDKEIVVAVAKTVEVKLVVKVPDGLEVVRPQGGGPGDTYLKVKHNCGREGCVMEGQEQYIPIHEALKEKGLGKYGITYSELN